MSLARQQGNCSLADLSYKIFSPLSEIPVVGRNLPYIVSFGLFVILCVPTALADSYASLLVLRFLTGFMGSPALATGGATMGDMVSSPPSEFNSRCESE